MFATGVSSTPAIAFFLGALAVFPVCALGLETAPSTNVRNLTREIQPRPEKTPWLRRVMMIEADAGVRSVLVAKSSLRGAARGSSLD